MNVVTTLKGNVRAVRDGADSFTVIAEAAILEGGALQDGDTVLEYARGKRPCRYLRWEPITSYPETVAARAAIIEAAL